MDAAAIPAAAMLRAATVGSARAMGLDDCDVLAAGKQADLIEINLQAPNLQPTHHIPESLVLNGDRANVMLTMCAGKILYENGEYQHISDVTKKYRPRIGTNDPLKYI